MTTITATQITGRHYRSGRTVQVELSGGQVAAVREVSGRPDAKSDLPWIAPGFVDIQSNGYGGQEFSSSELTAEKVARIAAIQPSLGVTKFCPTVTTNSAAVIVPAPARLSRPGIAGLGLRCWLRGFISRARIFRPRTVRAVRIRWPSAVRPTGRNSRGFKRPPTGRFES